MIFGTNKDKGIKLDGLKPVIINLSDGKHSIDEIFVHDELDENPARAAILANLEKLPGMPTPVGVFRQVLKPTYDGGVEEQIKNITEKKGAGDLEKVLFSGNTWIVN
jgi:2-oxoglutarate ferredoxin oxidoreductase subunit beta